MDGIVGVSMVMLLVFLFVVALFAGASSAGKRRRAEASRRSPYLVDPLNPHADEPPESPYHRR